MSEEIYFLLNVNDGKDVIHDPSRLTERCNTDQIEGRQRVDPRTATELVASGQAAICRHCGYQKSED